jgi:hypothetical protein
VAQLAAVNVADEGDVMRLLRAAVAAEGCRQQQAGGEATDSEAGAAAAGRAAA